jgi:uncharacterized membrane protein
MGMGEPYNRFTGQSLERLTALSDGLFAVAMTLLVPGDARQSRSRLAIFRRRILLAQTLYALAALTCVVSTQASVIALAVVQLYFIVSPRRPRSGRKRPDDSQDQLAAHHP